MNESLTDQEKILVMAHEEGHYYCGHKSGNKAISAVEEYEANEFAHYLLYVNPLSRHKKYKEDAGKYEPCSVCQPDK